MFVYHCFNFRRLRHHNVTATTKLNVIDSSKGTKARIASPLPRVMPSRVITISAGAINESLTLLVHGVNKIEMAVARKQNVKSKCCLKYNTRHTIAMKQDAAARYIAQSSQ